MLSKEMTQDIMPSDGTDPDGIRLRAKKARGPKRVSTAAWLTLLLLICSASKVFGLDFELEDQVLLTDIDPATNQGALGRALALGDDLVAMGAPQKTGGGTAYLFRITQARQMQFLRDFAPQSSPSRYGGTMVIDGDWLALGHESDDDPVELYQRSGNNFVLRKVLEPPVISGVTIRNFGQAMDLEGDLLIVGDRSANVGAVGNAGAVVIFRRDLGGANNWGLEAVLTDNPPANGNSYGNAVAVGTDTAVVGDPTLERALLYRRIGNNWQFSRLLAPLNPQAGDNFGGSVAAEGNYVAVGATNGNNAIQPTNSGSVHIFQRNQGGANQFGQAAEVVGSDADFIDQFGASIRLRQGVLVVGSPGANRAYLFRIKEGAWQEETVVAPPPVTFGNAGFGSAVDYLNGSMLVGADLWDDDSNRNGAVFLYENDLVRRCGSFDSIFCDGFEPN